MDKKFLHEVRNRLYVEYTTSMVTQLSCSIYETHFKSTKFKQFLLEYLGMLNLKAYHFCWNIYAQEEMIQIVHNHRSKLSFLMQTKPILERQTTANSEYPC